MHEAEHAELEAYRPTEDLQDIRTQEKIQKIVDAAKAAFPEKLEISNHKRVSDIQANRKEEIEAAYQQSIQAAEQGQQHPTPLGSDSTDDSELELDPIQKMLDQVLDEMY